MAIYNVAVSLTAGYFYIFTAHNVLIVKMNCDSAGDFFQAAPSVLLQMLSVCTVELSSLFMKKVSLPVRKQE